MMIFTMLYNNDNDDMMMIDHNEYDNDDDNDIDHGANDNNIDW